MKLSFDWNEYEALVRKAGAEGCVLLKNDNEALPVKNGEKVALFGRTQFDYIKSGSGSGGMVNIPYLVNVYDGFKNAGIAVDEAVADVYKEWLKDHPFDKGVGWAGEPFSQVEMPVESAMVAGAASRNDAAVVVFGRLAGEDKDNKPEEGSYLLREDERALLKEVCGAFKRVIVLINSGNIIDMKWVKEFNPAAVMYIWQGGVEGGNAAADVVTGKVTPCGKLTDTIAYDITDYPCEGNFGDPKIGIYAEDIFVGYRYFETFKKDAVLYPFGFGLSYTEFDHAATMDFDGDKITVKTKVTNVGKVLGKEVVQVYYKAPAGKLSKPERELAQFGKTGTLFAGASEDVTVSFDIKDMASYDDGGYTGFKNAFVLEAGTYEIYEGKDVRSAVLIGSVDLKETVLVEQTEDALSPKTPFKRMINDGGKVAWQDTPLRETPTAEFIERERATLKEIPYAGSQKHNLKEVRDGKIDLDTFIAGLSDEEMIQMTRGEGMCSARVCPGTAAAFAGVTDKLVSYGIPACCCSDGPSGIRMDVGTMAMQGPNGVALACTFDRELVESLYEYMGLELRYNKIDSLLGPGINIHRSPLNGRNFEYFSEDPYLTGAMAVAELKGMHKNKVTGTIKHFSCNNQEFGRHSIDSVVSKRALREIYLKGFEMAVKEGGAYNIMTTYGSLNGIHTASSFEQNIMVTRHDWGFEGLLETDWWTMINEEGGEPTRQNTSFMIRGGNDVYMVTSNSERNDNNDDSAEGLKNGVFTRAELQRNVRNILIAAMKTASFDRLCGEVDEWDVKNKPEVEKYEKLVEFKVEAEDGTVIDESLIDTSKGAMNRIFVCLKEKGIFSLKMDVAAEGSDLAQIPMVLSLNGVPKKVVLRNGADHEFREETLFLETFLSINVYVGISFNQDGIKLKNIHVVKEQMQ
ncbi:MAG: glycoside hydrolase family 3 protein [Lachnospiraceae bacterium]|nr:glycoside hydrolase family 3 protein [Lachnospiraceae bacterium]